MQPPSLIIQTVCFDESDRNAAGELGARLYDLLTRPRSQTQAHGPGIPVYRAVRPENIDLGAAQKLVLLPVLGSVTHATMRNQAMQRLKDWHSRLGSGHVIPVPMARVWRGEE